MLKIVTLCCTNYYYLFCKRCGWVLRTAIVTLFGFNFKNSNCLWLKSQGKIFLLFLTEQSFECLNLGWQLMFSLHWVLKIRSIYEYQTLDIDGFRFLLNFGRTPPSLFLNAVVHSYWRLQVFPILFSAYTFQTFWVAFLH